MIIKLVILIWVCSLLGCSKDDGPLDSQDDTVIEATVFVTGIPETGILLRSATALQLTPNLQQTTFRYRLNNEEWSSWEAFALPDTLATGLYELSLEAVHPSAVDTGRVRTSFALLTEERGAYLYPPFKSTIDDEVTLGITLPAGVSAHTAHVVFDKGSIDSCWLTASAGLSLDNTTLMYHDKTVDLAVLPGGVPFVGTRDLFTMRLSGLQRGDTLNYTIHLEHKDGSLLSLNGQTGLVQE